MLQKVTDITSQEQAGGLSTVSDIFNVKKNQSPDMMDVKVNIDGSVQKREGSKAMNATPIGGANLAGYDSGPQSLTNNLVSYWNMNETSGNRGDSYGTYDMVPSGTVSVESGKDSNAIKLSGGGSLSNASYVPFRGHSDFSISTWIYPTSFSSLSERTIASKVNKGITSPELFRPGNLSTNLVAWYKFDNDATDSSGNSYDLTAENTPAYATEDYWVTGEKSTDLVAGSSQYFHSANAAFNITGAYTVAGWVNADDTTTVYIVNRWAANKGYKVGINGSSQVFVANDASAEKNSTTTISAGRWYHVAVVYDQTNTIIYIDGNVDAVAAYTDDPQDSTGEFYVGSDATPANFWDGHLKDVAIWSEAKTPIQIKSLALGQDLSVYATRPGMNGVPNSTVGWTLSEAVASGNRTSITGSHVLADTGTIAARAGYIEGAAANFNGGNGDYLSIADDDDLFNLSGGTFSISFWIYNDALSTYYMSQWTADFNNYFFIDVDANGSISVSITTAASNVLLLNTPNSSVTTGKWHHVCVVEDGNTWTIYVDGKDTEATYAQGDGIQRMGDYTGDFILGANANGNSSHDGAIGDFHIWKGTALSAEQVRRLACGLDVNDQACVLYSKMDAASGDETSEIGGYTLTENGMIGSDTGQVGSARDFVAASEQEFTLSDDSDLDAKYSTILMWVNHDATGSEEYYYTKGVTANNEYTLSKNGANSVSFVCGNGASSISATSTLTVPASFTLVGAVANGANGNTIVNGVLGTASVVAGGFVGNSVGSVWGSKNSASNWFDGLMDEFLFFSRALTQDEITALYIKGLNGKEAFSSETSTSSTTDNYEYWLYINTDNIVTLKASSSGTSDQVTLSASSFGALNTATWYNVVAWHDTANTILGLAVNLSWDTKANATGILAGGSANLTLGALSNNSFGFYGRIDETSFWNRAITEPERRLLYSGGAGNFYDSGFGNYTWGGFDFGATDKRWLVVAAGTGLYASSDLGANFVAIATDRTAYYQNFTRSKNLLISTSEVRNPNLYWYGSGGTYGVILNTANNFKYADNYKGFCILMNSATRPRSFYYEDESSQITGAWSDVFDFPSSSDDEITGSFQIGNRFYVSLKDSIYRVTYVGGNPDWSYVKVRDWGFVARTIKVITFGEVGEVAIGMDKSRKIRVFDGSEDKIVSTTIENDNKMCDFAMSKVSYTGSGLTVSTAELDTNENVYKLCLAIGADSQQTTHMINFDGRINAFYPYQNQNWQFMVMAQSANRSYLMAGDRSGYIHMLNTGNLDNTVAINEHFDSPFIYEKSPSQIAKAHKIDLFLSPTSNSTLYYQERQDFSGTWKGRHKLIINNTGGITQIHKDIDVPTTCNVYQFRLTSSSGTSEPWKLNRMDFFTKGLGIGKNQ